MAEMKTRDDLVRWLDDWDVPVEALIEHLDDIGVVLVPKEPTDEMVHEAAQWASHRKSLTQAIAASPYRSKPHDAP